ncbi:MAG: hypothetical protein LJE97_20430 [Betaproteobacteria bacterium]|nr:hypothetical protein [Betaproteobacteria bacterium]
MKKALIGFVALVIVALVGGAIWLYLSLDFIVKHAIEANGSEILGAKVTVESVKLAPADGSGVVRGLAIANPPGFHSERSATVGTIDVSIEPASVTKDVVHVRRIVVIAPVITYESSRRGSNFDAIQRNVARRTGDSKSAASAETRLIVDQFVIRDARVIYAPEIATRGATISFNLPDIRLANVGKRQGGVTPAEFTNLVVRTLVARMAAAMGRSAAQRGADIILRGR